MILVVTPSRILNPGTLAARRVPRQFLGRGIGPVPRGAPFSALSWRLVFDQALARYCLALAPFPLAMLVWPDLAFGISQAPLLMILIVLFIESSVLSYPAPSQRRALLPEAEAARRLDTLAARARAALTKIAAARDMAEGTLTLVVEQSALARVPVLTLISVQAAPADGAEAPVCLELDKDEGALLAGLFDAAFPEAALHRANLRENVFLRAHTLDAAGLSAHARLAAMARRQAATRAAPVEMR